MFVFDGIFNRDDVLRLTRVDGLDDRGERGGLARTRGAADEHQAPLETGQQFGARRQVETRERRHLARQPPDRRRGPAAFAMQVDPESAHAGHLAGGVGDATFPECALCVRRELRQDHLLDVHAVERRMVGAHDAAVHAKCRRLTGDQQQIAAVPFGDKHEPAFEARRALRRVEARRFELRDEPIEIVSRHACADIVLLKSTRRVRRV